AKRYSISTNSYTGHESTILFAQRITGDARRGHWLRGADGPPSPAGSRGHRLSACAQGAAAAGQSQGGHLDLLLRRREPGGYLRSEAGAAAAPGRNDGGRGPDR